ncbi:MAG TPA: hypothetical protein VHG71_06235 [Verrucomicrobiae bacterium]|nr:hypothetical protein [Verrucomicrobiae bacterium]
MQSKFILCLALILSGGLTGRSTTNQHANWPVFHDSEKGATHLSISREPKTLAFYTNEIPDWNEDLRVPTAKINSAEEKELGQIDGLRILQVHLVLDYDYYTDAVMILEEVEPQQFLPVYVQDYNRSIRSPSANIISQDTGKFIVETGMDYEGTGHFHNRYKITISPKHDPIMREYH